MHVAPKNSSILAKTLFLSASFLLIAATFYWTRTDSPPALFNMDEGIAPAVASAMLERHDFNGNWNLANTISEHFKYDQHNFYSYHLIAMPFTVVGDVMASITRLRYLNFFMQGFAIILASLALNLSAVPISRVLTVSLALTIAPVMVMDSHIARAESLLYLLLAGLCLTAAFRSKNPARFVIAGLLLGFGSASKVTFVAAGVIFLPEICRWITADARSVIRPILLAIASAVAGFAIGAPYAILEPAVFFNGVASLMRQYSTEHPPHSFSGDGVLDYVSHLVLFCTITSGAIWACLYVKPRQQADWLLGLAIFAGGTFAYFAIKPVFFERNIGLALFAAIVVAFAIRRSRLATAALFSSLAVMASWSWNIADVAKNRSDRLNNFEVAMFGASVPHNWPYPTAIGMLDGCAGIVGLIDYEDPLSKDMIQQIGADPVATFEGRFSMIPTSTLQAYLETTIRYYQCKVPG